MSTKEQVPAETTATRQEHRSIAWKTAVILLIGLSIFFLPAPEGVDPRGMPMLAIFVATIAGLILQPLPTPAISIIGLAVAMLTGAMRVGSGDQNEALAGFANPAVLLIVAAFFIADGFLLTGLGRRMALLFVSWLGRSPLGIAYGMAATDLLLSPATPSTTARAGGVLYPIIRSISEVQGSTPETDASRRKLGSYLTFTALHVDIVTSAMFITAMAGNPVAQKAAAELGVSLSWGTWAIAALVPGIVSLVLVPWLMLRIYGPSVRETPEAPAMAREELARMGRMSRGEIIMLITFVALLTMWVLGSLLGINATAAAFAGIAILLATRVLSWRDMAANGSAWSTLLFFAVLVGMADQLSELGVIDWIGGLVSGLVGGMPWGLAFALLSLVYFYVHYLFASNTAQIVAMYAVFLGAAIAAGTPPVFAALMLGFIGNLFGALSHYASGPAGVIYGSGYVKVGEWFRVAFIMSLALILVWGVLGTAWMGLLGLLS